MTTLELKKMEKIASESMRYARKSLKKSRELEIYLSVLDYKAGRVKEYASVDAIFRAAKRLGRSK